MPWWRSKPLRACEIPRSVSKTVNNFFHDGLHLRPKKSNSSSGDDVRTMCCYFLVRNASSGEKSCLQFSVPTGSGVGGEGGFSHRLKGVTTHALPVCCSCFVPLRRFRENLTKPFYFYLSRTCDSPGSTPSVISLALK